MIIRLITACATGNYTDWEKFGRGLVVSMSQVYAVNDIPTSIMMNIAVLLASPLNFITSTAGALIGCLLGIPIYYIKYNLPSDL